MMEAGKGFRALDEKAMIEYIKATPELLAKLGNQLEGLNIKEISDGNVNFVYTVVGNHGSFVIKQAPPYMRCLGESYPMSPERAYFEALALKELRRLCPNHVPEVYHFDRTTFLLVMRYIEPPHVLLRKGLIAGIEYPLLAEHMSEYLAKTLYFTSLLFRSASEHKRSVAEFIGNVEPCGMARYYFSESFKDSDECTRWTSPYLDNDAKAVRQDDNLKLEIAKLKSMFCERAQALIHGDLHTSAVMVTTGSTQVIDPEFAFYGPIGYDIGSFVAHLIIAFFAQDGLANQEQNDRKKYKQWILRIIEETWNLFEKKFVSLWNEHKDGNGEAYLSTVYNTPELQILVQKNYMKDLLQDSLGFGAAKLIRNTMTMFPVEDFASITNDSERACCERHALNLGKLLLKERHRFESIGQVITAIQDISSI